MTFSWKRTLVIALDTVVAVYLLLAVTAFNKPDEEHIVCSQVKIDISDDLVDGFLNADEIKHILQRNNIYPLGLTLDRVSVRRIEETLEKSPFVDHVQCHKSGSGHVCISVTQRMPLVRVKAEDGDDYYIDSRGGIMPNTRYTTDLIVATGHISRKYAAKFITPVAGYIVKDKFWQNQVEQINVLEDGSMEIVPRVGNHVVYLGRPYRIDRKLKRLEKFYRYGLNKVGWEKYSYISVEFDNQIICKKRDAAPRRTVYAAPVQDATEATQQPSAADGQQKQAPEPAAPERKEVAGQAAKSGQAVRNTAPEARRQTGKRAGNVTAERTAGRTKTKAGKGRN